MNMYVPQSLGDVHGHHWAQIFSKGGLKISSGQKYTICPKKTSKKIFLDKGENYYFSPADVHVHVHGRTSSKIILLPTKINREDGILFVVCLLKKNRVVLWSNSSK